MTPSLILVKTPAPPFPQSPLRPQTHNPIWECKGICSQWSMQALPKNLLEFNAYGWFGLYLARLKLML